MYGTDLGNWRYQLPSEQRSLLGIAFQTFVACAELSETGACLRLELLVLFTLASPIMFCTHCNMIFRDAVTFFSSTLNFEAWNFWCQELEEKEDNASILHALQDWHWGCPSLIPCLLHRARKKLLLCCGSRQCVWCSLLSSSGMLFLPNGHKVFGLNPAVPGQLMSMSMA